MRRDVSCTWEVRANRVVTMTRVYICIYIYRCTNAYNKICDFGSCSAAVAWRVSERLHDNTGGIQEPCNILVYTWALMINKRKNSLPTTCMPQSRCMIVLGPDRSSVARDVPEHGPLVPQLVAFAARVRGERQRVLIVNRG